MNTYTYKELEIGHLEQFEVQIEEEMLNKFKDITGDINRLHTDADFALNRGYKNKVVYGMLTASFLSTLAGVYLPGETSLIMSTNVSFVKPVFIGDKLQVKGTIKEKNDLYQFITIKVEIRNQDEIKVLRGDMQIKVLK